MSIFGKPYEVASVDVPHGLVRLKRADGVPGEFRMEGDGVAEFAPLKLITFEHYHKPYTTLKEWTGDELAAAIMALDPADRKKPFVVGYGQVPPYAGICGLDLSGGDAITGLSVYDFNPPAAKE